MRRHFGQSLQLRLLLLVVLAAHLATCRQPATPAEEPLDPDEEEDVEGGVDEEPPPAADQPQWEFVAPDTESTLDFRHLRHRKSRVCLEVVPGDAVKFATCQPSSEAQQWLHRAQEGRFVSRLHKEACLKSDRKTAPCSDPYTEFEFTGGRLVQRRSGKAVRPPEAGAAASAKPQGAEWELVRLVGGPSTHLGAGGAGPRAGSPVHLEPRYLRFKNQASGKYLGLSKSDLPMLWIGDNVWSYWVWRDGMLINRAHPFNCVSRQPNQSLLGTDDCNKSREWLYDGRHFRHNATAECIAVADDKQELGDLLVLRPCTSGADIGGQLSWLMEPVANLDPGSSPKVIRHVDSGNCVGHLRRKFALAECNSTQRDVLWRFDADSGHLRLVGSAPETHEHLSTANNNRCLTRNNLTKTLRLGACNEAARWDYDAWQLHHRSTNNYCLDDYWNRHDIDSQILAHDCQPIDSLGQRFHLEEPPLSPAPVDVGVGYQFLVDADGSNCVSVSESKRISLASCNDKPNIRWLYDTHNGYIRSRQDHDWCLGKTTGGASQKFAIFECGHQDAVWFHDGEQVRPARLHSALVEGQVWHFEAAPNKDVGIAPVQVKLAGMCAKVTGGQEVVLDLCDKAQASWWTYEPSSGHLKSRLHRDRCLSRPVNSSRLRLADCDRVAQWDYDGTLLRHRSHIHECLDSLYGRSDPGDALVTLSCWNVINEVTIE